MTTGSTNSDSAGLETIDLSRALHQASGPKSLLRNISFRLEQGQVLAVLGPSGAGKSTLLRMLNRLDEPSGGTVLLQGKDCRQMDPRQLRRRIGMVMQRAYLFSGTAAMNVRYGPAQHGSVLQPSQVSELIRQVGMAGYENRDVATLSGGEAQRISIARALANQPEVLLLDEPTSALDDASKQEIERLLASLVRERNVTCVWVTHDVAQARRVADVVLKLEAGEAAGFGSPRELLHARLFFHTQMSLGLAQAAVVALLAMLVAWFAGRRGAKIGREIPLVLLRGLVQILLVGLLIAALLRGPWWTGIPVLAAMIFIAATIVRRRVPELLGAYTLSLLCMCAGAGGVLTVMTVLGIVEPKIIILIPVGSMVIAQNMNIQSLFLNRFLGEVRSHRGEIESALALGAALDRAAEPYLHASFHASLIPATDNLRSLGIVWIPGMMAGMVLSGTSPIYAALYQFVILGMIFIAGVVSCMTATYLVPRKIFTPQQQLRRL